MRSDGRVGGEEDPGVIKIHKRGHHMIYCRTEESRGASKFGERKISTHGSFYFSTKDVWWKGNSNRVLAAFLSNVGLQSMQLQYEFSNW